MKMLRSFGVELELNCRLRNRPKRRVDFDVDALPWSQATAYRELNTVLPHFYLLPGWKQKYDSSCGSELVSPPITETSTIATIIERFLASGIPHTFKDTGLHVHVAAIDYDDEDAMAAVKFCRHFDRTIFSFFHPKRIKDSMCGMVARDDAAIQREIDRGEALDRYYGCNLDAWYEYGTIEFRYSEGHLNYDKVEAMIEMFVAIVEYCKNNKEKVKSPRKIKEKRGFLLNLLNLSEKSKKTLLEAKYE